MKNAIWYFDLGFVSMLTLCTLSVGRMASFYSIGPLNGKVTKYCTALKIVLSIWVYSLALSLPPLVGWGRYVPELSGLGWVYLLLFHIFAYWHLSFPDWVIDILWPNWHQTRFCYFILAQIKICKLNENVQILVGHFLIEKKNYFLVHL